MSTDWLREDALACHAAALAAVEPGRLVSRALASDAGGLVLRSRAGRTLAVHAGPVRLVGAGKAALAMARTAGALAGERLDGGVVVVPHGGAGPCVNGVTVAEGGHPLPDRDGEAATARLLAAVESADARTLVLVLLSGGASALLAAPAAGLTLEDEIEITRRLLASGADIAAMNTVRKHCSRLKGGGLARVALGSAGIWTLVLSDVVGDDPATIASGPTVADPTTFADVAAILARHLAPGDVPEAVRRHLARGCAGLVADTVKPGDPVLARVTTIVVGGNGDAVAAAGEAATAHGYVVHPCGEPLVGDAAKAGRMLAARLDELPRGTPVALVAGGETTVRVQPGGRGGRSQQLALAAALALAGKPGVLLAVGTDGVDGPTDAAGACVDGRTVERARQLGLDPERALAATDSHPLLDATGDLVRTGPTGTNVADLVVALHDA